MLVKFIRENVLGGWFTSLAGSVAGVPEMIHGYTTHDVSEIVKGAGLFLLGLAAKH